MKQHLLFALSLCLCLVAACDSDTNTCQDGILDPGEECDTDALGSCQDLGYYQQNGLLICQSNCKYDRSVCEEFCGDGILQALHEDCEQDDLGGLSCESMGLGSGTLTCTANCIIDTAACEVQPECGDQQVITPVEQCEGDDLQGQTCQSLGFAAGTLTCGSDCRFDTTACQAVVVTCGNGVWDSGEECDGSDFHGVTCEGQGFAGGNISCTGDCRISTSGCEPYPETCGNGIWDNGEACDGSDLNGASCAGLGYDGGQLACTSDCQFDTSPCYDGEGCGDGIWQNGEACDGSDLNGASCIGLGFTGGQLSCSPECQFDTSTCTDAACGNNVRENGEVCDGSDLGGETCSSRGYYDGTLLCSWDCQGFDESNCINP